MMRVSSWVVLAWVPWQARGLMPTNLSCGLGCTTTPRKFPVLDHPAPPAWEPLPYGSLAPRGWVLEQLLLQANSLSGFMPTSTFPGAAAVNTSMWTGGKMTDGTTQWLPYWTNGNVPLLMLLRAAGPAAMARLDPTAQLGAVIDSMVAYVLAHTNKTNGWIGPWANEPGDSNGHGLWDPLNMLRSLLMYAEAEPASRRPVARAVVAHLTEEAKLIRTDPIYKWASTRWPTYVQVAMYVIDHLVPAFGGDADVMPLGGQATSALLLDSARLFRSKGMDWLAYYNRTGPVKFPLGSVGGWNTNDHGVNNAEGALAWPAMDHRLGGPAAHGHASMALALHMLDTYQAQPNALFCADEVFCGRAPHRGTETCAVVEAMASLEQAFAVLGEAELYDRVEALAFNALPAALTADMWTHVYVQQANSVFAGKTRPSVDSAALRHHGLHHGHAERIDLERRIYGPAQTATHHDATAHHHATADHRATADHGTASDHQHAASHHQHASTRSPTVGGDDKGGADEAAASARTGDPPDEASAGRSSAGRCGAAAVGAGGPGSCASHRLLQEGAEDTPSGEDQGANFYGVSHFPCCITNFPQGWPKFVQSAVLVNASANAFVVAALLPLNATLPATIGGGATVSIDTTYPFGQTATLLVTVPDAHTTTVHIRIPGWASGATVDGAPAVSGALHPVPLQAGRTRIEVRLPMSVRVERGWGMRGERASAPVSFSRAHAGLAAPAMPLPSGTDADWLLDGGASLAGSRQAAAFDIRTGNPGSSSWLINTHPIYGASHALIEVNATFSYSAGYTPPKGQPKLASNVSLHLLDAVTRADVSGPLLSWPSALLGSYSYDDFHGYSPPLSALVSGLSIPNAKPLVIALRVDNNQRNLQIPLPSIALAVKWAVTASTQPPSPIAPYLTPPTDAAVVRRGALLFALHPTETRKVVQSYDKLLPARPLAVDYEISTADKWAYALELQTDELETDELQTDELQTDAPRTSTNAQSSASAATADALLKFDPTPSAGWSLSMPFSTEEYPFSIVARGRPLDNATWGYWEQSMITAQPPPSPLNCTALGAACGPSEALRLVPFGATNLRISVFPWLISSLPSGGRDRDRDLR